MLQAIIFDFDGVIVDSEPWHHKAFNAVLETDHIHIEWDLYQKLYIGFDDRDALKTAFKKARKHLSSKNFPNASNKKPPSSNNMPRAANSRLYRVPFNS